MAKSNVTIDSSQVTNLFNSLNQETQKEIMMKGLKQGAKYLQSKTQETLVRKFPKAQSTKGKANRTMYEGVTIKPIKVMTEVDVSIMSNYLNIFFEGGTDERYRKVRYQDKKGKTRVSKDKKGGYTGRLKALNFFAETRQQEENNVIKTIEDEIGKQINKLVK